MNYKKGKTNINPYHDPDTVKGKCVDNQIYYNLLTEFLNAQAYNEKKNGMLFFPPEPESADENRPYNRTILMANDNNEEIFLCSDQFGFSELDDNCRNPYYSIISKHKNEDEAFRFVAKCLFKTRKIGGSFIWPKEKNGRNWSCMYNILRGTRNYIRDRVDLTLLEIKNYCDNKEQYNKDKQFDKDIMFGFVQDDKAVMTKWLNQFDDFSDFVKFFKFEDFCVEQKGEMGKIKYHPKDITKKEDTKLMRQETKKIEDMEVEELEEMLKKLSTLVEIRSQKMINIVIEERKRIQNINGSQI